MEEGPVSRSCCEALSRWQAIRQAAERNGWPFYVGLPGEEPLQLALASSIAPQRSGPGDPSQALGSPMPLLDVLSAKLPSLPSPPDVRLEDPRRASRTAVPLASPGSVSAALAVDAAETQLLLQEAKDEKEHSQVLRALEFCSVSGRANESSTAAAARAAAVAATIPATGIPLLLPSTAESRPHSISKGTTVPYRSQRPIRRGW